MYTKDDIKKWFQIMKNKYKGSFTEKNLKDVEMLMLDSFWKNDNIDTIINKEV